MSSVSIKLTAHFPFWRCFVSLAMAASRSGVQLTARDLTHTSVRVSLSYTVPRMMVFSVSRGVFKNKSRRRARAREGEGKKTTCLSGNGFPSQSPCRRHQYSCCRVLRGVWWLRAGERAGGYTYRFRRLPKAPRSTRRLLSHIILLRGRGRRGRARVFLCVLLDNEAWRAGSVWESGAGGTRERSLRERPAAVVCCNRPAVISMFA